MPPRRKPVRPVEIVLTEEDLAAIIRETAGAAPGAGGGAWTGPPPVVPFPGSSEAGFPSIGDRVWRLGGHGPGAVGDAIRMILEATTLDRGKPAGRDDRGAVGGAAEEE